MKNYLAVLALPVLVISCNGSKSSHSGPIETQDTKNLEEAPKTKAVVKNLNESDVQVKIESLAKYDINKLPTEEGTNFQEFVENLNKRRIIFKVSGQDISNKQLKVICEQASIPVFEAEFKGQEAVIDFTIPTETQKSAQYQLACKYTPYNGQYSLLDTRISLKKDFYITDTKELDYFAKTRPTELRVGALVLDRGTIKTNGSNIKIKAEQFVSNNGSIITFAPNESAEKGFKGQDGGSIKILADKSAGRLTVAMRGQNAGASSLVDKSYKRPSFNIKDYQNDCQLETNMTIELSTPGPMDLTGLPGGNTGKFSLKALDSNHQVEIETVPGKGGAGGFSYTPHSEKPKLILTAGTGVPTGLNVCAANVSCENGELPTTEEFQRFTCKKIAKKYNTGIKILDMAQLPMDGMGMKLGHPYIGQDLKIMLNNHGGGPIAKYNLKYTSYHFSIPEALDTPIQGRQGPAGEVEEQEVVDNANTAEML